MSQEIKELLVVVVIASAIFRLARPVALLFNAERDFVCRRNAWFAVTVAAFLCPSFWVFCVVAAFIIRWSARRDSNSPALYLMLLYAVPNYSWRLPMVGISYLVDLDFATVLSLCLMAPAALRIARSAEQRRLQLADYCLLAYLALTSVYFLLPEVARGVLMTPTMTDCLRRAVEAFVAIYLPFFVISRAARSCPEIQDAVATLCLACAVMAAIATFEGARHWLVYGALLGKWDPSYNAYLERGSMLRARASTSHSLFLGYVLAVAFGLWLGLMPRVQSVLRRAGAIVLYWLGLLAAYSRGPWLGAILIYFVYVWAKARRLSRLLKAALTAGLLAAIVLATPLGERIVRVVPFLGGTVDASNITYRERLLSRAWEVIQDSPLLGDQYALAKLQDLRAAGIIDLMNGFVHILLDNGFVGLTLFLGLVIVGLHKGWKLGGDTPASSVPIECSTLAAALVACLVGTMLMMWVGGLILAPTTLLVALICACARLEAPLESQPENASNHP